MWPSVAERGKGMRVLAVAVAVMLVVLGHQANALAQEELWTSFTIDLELEKEIRGDSVQVVARAAAINNAGTPVECCGFIDFRANYEPDQERLRQRAAYEDSAGIHQCLPYLAWFVTIDYSRYFQDGKLVCDPVVWSPGAALRDSLVIAYHKSRFVELAGRIRVRAYLVAGEPGTDWLSAVAPPRGKICSMSISVD
jgi:hypothetical protein